MEEWFTTGACDGFNVLPPYFNGGLDRLRRAGGAGTAAARTLPHRLRRTTLRENLGLPRPESRYAAAAKQPAAMAAAK